MGKFSLQHSTAMSRAKGGVTKRKKCNTQRKPGYPKVMGKIEPRKKKRGDPEVNENSEEGIPTKIKALVYSRVGCRQPTSSGC